MDEYRKFSLLDCSYSVYLSKLYDFKNIYFRIPFGTKIVVLLIAYVLLKIMLKLDCGLAQCLLFIFYILRRRGAEAGRTLDPIYWNASNSL